MNHEEWKATRCQYWDLDCMDCIKKECLDDQEYEPEE